MAKNTGVIALVASHAYHLVGVLRDSGRDVPAEFGVIGIDVLGDESDILCDVMCFQREHLFDRMIAEVTASEWQAPREYVEPVWQRHDSVR